MILMAEGTQLKQLENHMETMEYGMTQTQEVVTQSREEIRAICNELRENIASSREGVQRELARQREMLDQFRQRIGNVVSMLSALPQF